MLRDVSEDVALAFNLTGTLMAAILLAVKDIASLLSSCFAKGKKHCRDHTDRSWRVHDGLTASQQIHAPLKPVTALRDTLTRLK